MGEASVCEALLRAQPNARQSVIAGPAPLAGTCSVSARPCTPASPARSSNIQVTAQRSQARTAACLNSLPQSCKLRLPPILHPLHEPLFKVIHELAYLG